MGDFTDLSTAIHILDKKIAKLNSEIVKNRTEELENELKKYLDIQYKIKSGNTELIEKVVKGEE